MALARHETLLGGDARRSAPLYDRILAMIVSGEAAESSRLPSETELAQTFGVSRPVVREALARLREDGLVVSRRGSGSYVRRRPHADVLRFAPLESISDIQRCFEFRVDLESAAAAHAAERWEEQDMVAIEASFEEMESCVRRQEIGVDADVAFHIAIAQAAHNSYHLSTQLTLQSHVKAGMLVTRSLSVRHSERRMRLVQDEHAAIVKALRARDAAAAGRAMESHIRNARQRMFEGTKVLADVPDDRAASGQSSD